MATSAIKKSIKASTNDTDKLLTKAEDVILDELGYIGTASNYRYQDEFRSLHEAIETVRVTIPPVPVPDQRPSAIQAHLQELSQDVQLVAARVNQGLLKSEPLQFSSAEIALIVQQVCSEVGLDGSLALPDFNLSATGKLHEVLARTAEYLNQRHPLATTSDVVDFFAQTSRTLAKEPA